MAKHSKLRLAALVQDGPRRRAELAQLVMRPRNAGGAPRRRGKAGALFWATVRAVMLNHGCGHPTACRILVRRYRDIRDEAKRTGEIERWARESLKWGTWKQASLEREYRDADRRYRRDKVFHDECDLWLPIFRDADWLQAPKHKIVPLRNLPPAPIGL